MAAGERKEAETPVQPYPPVGKEFMELHGNSTETEWVLLWKTGRKCSKNTELLKSGLGKYSKRARRLQLIVFQY